jgi:hypothetical protein
MQEEERAELARQEGAELRVTSVSLLADGSVRLAGFDMGPAVEEFWGDEDYEFWVRVPTEAVARLGFLLLREKYAGCADAVARFREFCEQHKIAHEFDNWV